MKSNFNIIEFFSLSNLFSNKNLELKIFYSNIENFRHSKFYCGVNLKINLTFKYNGTYLESFEYLSNYLRKIDCILSNIYHEELKKEISLEFILLSEKFKN